MDDHKHGAEAKVCASGTGLPPSGVRGGKELRERPAERNRDLEWGRLARLRKPHWEEAPGLGVGARFPPDHPPPAKPDGSLQAREPVEAAHVIGEAGGDEGRAGLQGHGDDALPAVL